MSNSKKGNQRDVYDERGNCYTLTQKIGEGGQGIVCATNHDNVLVKICTRPKDKRDEWIEHIRWLMLQDLEKLQIARPIARIIKPRLGYVMELMDGLQSLEKLMEETELGLQDGDVKAYIHQGGIQRRLTLMSKLARTLADLHGRGMAFGDLSPANVFVSEDFKHNELWLIDCDNICVSQRLSFDTFQEGQGGRVYTPFYGAPEIVTGSSLVSSLTDCWSFAVIAFRLLTAIHPLIGDLVSDGEPELEEDALSGKLPWVDHPDDDSNKASVGFPRELVLLEPLKVLFERCFNAGRDEPEQRPSMAEWAETIEHCIHWLVDCKGRGCHSSYFYKLDGGTLACSFCGRDADSDSILLLRHYLYDPTIKDIDGAESKDCYIDTGIRQVANIESKTPIKTSPPGSGFYKDAAHLYDIDFSDKGVTINPAEGVELVVKIGSAKAGLFKTAVHLKLKDRQKRNVYVRQNNVDQSVHECCIFKW